VTGGRAQAGQVHDHRQQDAGQQHEHQNRGDCRADNAGHREEPSPGQRHAPPQRGHRPQPLLDLRRPGAEAPHQNGKPWQYQQHQSREQRRQPQQHHRQRGQQPGHTLCQCGKWTQAAAHRARQLLAQDAAIADQHQQDARRIQSPPLRAVQQAPFLAAGHRHGARCAAGHHAQQCKRQAPGQRYLK